MKRPVVLLAIQIVAVTAILACLVALVARAPVRVDLTPDRRFTLSPHSREVLARVTAPIDVTVFFSSQDPTIRRDLDDLLALYADRSPHLRVRFLDLDRNPGAAERLEVTSYNIAVLESGERRDYLHVVNEDTFTAALLRLTGVPPVRTVFVLGHGETDPRDDEDRDGAGIAAAVLTRDGFIVRAADGAGALPEDVDLIILAGPTRDLTVGEVDAIGHHVRAGKGLVVLVDPPGPPSVGRMVASFGIELSGDVVYDDRAKLFGTDGLSARVAYLNEELVPEPPDANALLPVAQTVRLVDRPGVHGDYLAVTGETTWADVDRRASNDANVTFRPGIDRRGPLPVAAVARVATEGGKVGRVVVVGDADFVTNRHVEVLGNRDLLGVAAALAARDETLGASRPSSPAAGLAGFSLTAREARWVLVSTAVVPPLILSAIAALMARRRRRA